MRDLDPAFTAHIQSGATTLATCWRLIRTDGTVLGFTDHDLPLSFDGTQFVPAHGLEGGEITAKLGAQTDTSDVIGVLNADAITEDDILLGRYDGAVVETWKANWRNTAVRQLMRRDTIGEITREDDLFRAELRSGQHALNTVQGRFFQSMCDAELGDARCGVDAGTAAFKAMASVTQILDHHRLRVSGISSFSSTWFVSGRAQWTAGKRLGLVDRLTGQTRDSTGDVLAFDAPVGDWVAAGDGFNAIAGCDRLVSTCAEKFGNAVNFRGCPHIPGADLLLRYPRDGALFGGEALIK